MARYVYNKEAVNGTIDQLEAAIKKIDDVNSTIQEGFSIIQTARGGNYIDISSADALKYKDVTEQAIRGIIADIRSKAQMIEEYNSASWFTKASSTVQMAFSKFVEGFLTAGENIIDGFASLGGLVAGVFSEDAKNAVGEFIAKDHVGDLFKSAYDDGILSDVEKYSCFSSESTAANVFKGFGVATGYVAAIAVTGAPVSSLGANMAVAGIGGMGSGTQDALRAGYTYDEAALYGAKKGAIQAGTVYAFGKGSELLGKGMQKLFTGKGAGGANEFATLSGNSTVNPSTFDLVDGYGNTIMSYDSSGNIISGMTSTTPSELLLNGGASAGNAAMALPAGAESLALPAGAKSFATAGSSVGAASMALPTGTESLANAGATAANGGIPSVLSIAPQQMGDTLAGAQANASNDLLGLGAIEAPTVESTYTPSSVPPTEVSSQPTVSTPQSNDTATTTTPLTTNTSTPTTTSSSNTPTSNSETSTGGSGTWTGNSGTSNGGSGTWTGNSGTSTGGSGTWTNSPSTPVSNPDTPTIDVPINEPVQPVNTPIQPVETPVQPISTPEIPTNDSIQPDDTPTIPASKDSSSINEPGAPIYKHQMTTKNNSTKSSNSITKGVASAIIGLGVVGAAGAAGYSVYNKKAREKEDEEE